MPGFQREILIQRPPADVFQTVTDPFQTGLWLGDILGIEVLERGPISTGSRFNQTRLLRGKEVTNQIEIVEHRGPEAGTPPFTHSARSEMMGIQAEYRYHFEDGGSSNTRVKLEAIAEATNFMAKALLGMAVQGMEEEDGEQLERLKTLMEEDA